MNIPFVKAQGAGNDFLLTMESEAPAENRDAIARAICHRQFGVGADGWYLVSRSPGSNDGAGDEAPDAVIHLFNSDGSQAELSGNGTRCVAAWLASLSPESRQFRLQTGAGLRYLRLMEARDNEYRLAMNMGSPLVAAKEKLSVQGWASETVSGNRVEVGNPQFAVEVPSLAFDWKALGSLLEGHPAFPARSNISFYCRRDSNTIEARFYERGAGPTLSSGTGSTGALAAALDKGLVSLPATVATEAGPLQFRHSSDGLMLEGSAILIADGVYHCPESVIRATESESR